MPGLWALRHVESRYLIMKKRPASHDTAPAGTGLGHDNKLGHIALSPAYKTHKAQSWNTEMGKKVALVILD